MSKAHRHHSHRQPRARRPPARSAWAQARRGEPAPGRPVSTREVVWLDMEPLLARERERVEAVSAEMDGFNRELERFKSEWEPGFSRWYHSRFGSRITRARELEAKLIALEELIHRVETESMLRGCSEKAAYRRIERERVEQERLQEGMERLARMRAEGASAEAAAAELPPEVEELILHEFDRMLKGVYLSPAEYDKLHEDFKREFLAQVLGGRGADSEAGEREGGEDREEFARAQARRERKERRDHDRLNAARARFDAAAHSDPEESRRKKLYRELARRLHPDANGGLTARERELWHEVQKAYDAKDLEQLELLEGMIHDGSAGGWSRIRSLSRLKSVFLELEKKLRSLRRTLREARKSPAWNFFEVERNPSRIDELERRMGGELERAIEELAEELEIREARVAAWKRRGA